MLTYSTLQTIFLVFSFIPIALLVSIWKATKNEGERVIKDLQSEFKDEDCLICAASKKNTDKIADSNVMHAIAWRSLKKTYFFEALVYTTLLIGVYMGMHMQEASGADSSSANITVNAAPSVIKAGRPTMSGSSTTKNAPTQVSQPKESSQVGPTVQVSCQKIRLSQAFPILGLIICFNTIALGFRMATNLFLFTVFG